uniref:Reticulophagy regulator 1 n=1 Tax=Dicentrarchus labrax TaxID=13489 RepID=A0A8P4KSF3_DICLA
MTGFSLTSCDSLGVIFLGLEIYASEISSAPKQWSWEIIDSGQDSRSGTGPQLSDSLKLFLQETSAFKQQNPGKFCLLVCSLCTFFAVLGRYIPGIVISYILVLGVFLWPLISSHEVGLWLEPVLQKLDFGIGEFLQKIKENHEKRMMQAQTEKEGIESDLSSMFPKLDSTVCKEMSVSDTEVSDVTWTDNGTFNLSEGHTPQTENSEDLDREEAFTGGLPEFPSLDNGATTNGDDDDDLSLGLPSPQPQPQKSIKSKHTPSLYKDQPTDKALELVNQMAGDVIAAAVTAAIQERIEAAVGLTALSEDLERSRLPESSRLLELAEESDSEVEDFELLDQSELEQLEGELGLGEKKVQAKEEAKSDQPASSGFFSKLLRRH